MRQIWSIELKWLRGTSFLLAGELVGVATQGSTVNNRCTIRPCKRAFGLIDVTHRAQPARSCEVAAVNIAQNVRTRVSILRIDRCNG